MSATALVRSPSNSSLTPVQRTSSSSPSATSTPILPKLGLSPNLQQQQQQQQQQQSLRQQPQISSTASKTTPTTPQQPLSAPATPGRWQHPRMEEIIRRQSKTRFDKRNVNLVLLNTAVIVATFAAHWCLCQVVPADFMSAVQPYLFYLLLVVYLYFTANISMAILPLLRTPDACEDIPLTPAQRRLLGLPPMSRPATPQEQEQYVTPPRYSRSATPKSSTGSLRGPAGGSPLSGRGTPLDSSTMAPNSQFGGSAYQPWTGSGSPFAAGLRGGVGGAERRRLSYTSNRSSPLSTSEFDAAGSVSTPTKSHRASVGLNSKWLFVKGKASPKSWGTGSVFS